MTQMTRIPIHFVAALLAALVWLRPAAAASWAEEREALHARQFAAEGRHELVVSQCRQFRERFPSSQLSDLILDLEGRSWLGLKRPAEALGAFQSLVQRHSASPLVPDAQLAAGECLSQLGRAAEAVKLWRRLAQQFPDTPQAVQALLRAEDLTPRAESRAREELLRLAAELDSESDAGLEARRRWALLLVDEGQGEAARTLLERVLRESAPGPGHLRVLLELDRLLLEDQRGEESLALLGRNLALYEGDSLRSRLWLVLAARRLQLGRLFEAERGLRQALDEEDSRLESPARRDSLRLLLGDALAMQGEEQEAEAAWASCAHQGPELRLRRGLSLERSGQSARAAAQLAIAVDSLAARHSAPSFPPRLFAATLAALARTQEESGLPELAWERVGELSRWVEPELPEATPLAEILLHQGLRTDAARLLDPHGEAPGQADRRGWLRVRLAVEAGEWAQAVELARIFRERWSVSPLWADVDSLCEDVARPAARQAELNRRLAELRQGRGADAPRAQLETGWLQLREQRRPADALRSFAAVPPESPEDLVSEARMGTLAACVELGRTEAALEEWEAGDRQLARSPWGLQALRALWSVEAEPSAERRRERITLLENLRRKGRCDPAELAGELLDQWNGLRESIAAAGGATQAQADCARKALQWADSLHEPEPARLLVRSLCREALGEVSAARQDWKRILQESVEDPAAVVAARNLALQADADSATRAEIAELAAQRWAWHPISRPLRREIAGLERRAGRPAVSVALCQTLQDEDAARQAPAPFPTTSDPQLLDELAQGLEQTGEGAEARRTWLLALSGPVLRDTLTASRMLLRVARSFLAAGREEDALRSARTLTTVFPGTPAAGGATRLLAQQESKAGRPAEALALLETLRPAQSADLSLRTQWVKALARVGREEKSRTELQRLLKENNGRVNEDTVKAAVGLARGIGLLERKLPAEAEKAFGQVVGKQERTPQAAAAQLGVARALQAQGKLPACGKALLALEKRWPRAPEAAGAQTLKAELAEAAGDTTQALAALERAVDLSPAAQRPGALSAWIDAAARLQRPRVERTSLERYLSENPQAADAEARRLELALLLAEAGEGAAARAALRALQAEADETRSAEIQYRLGELAEREGDLPGAVLEYQKVPHVKDASRLDWDASAMFAAARCWEALGRRPEALETLRQIQTRQGENSGHGMRAKAELERLGALQP